VRKPQTGKLPLDSPQMFSFFYFRGKLVARVSFANRVSSSFAVESSIQAS
jgi:hypothetical protein